VDREISRAAFVGHTRGTSMLPARWSLNGAHYSVVKERVGKFGRSVLA
jgi:hypothetical protein